MKHYFIINPYAGNGRYADGLKEKIDAYFAGKETAYEIYITKAPHDATEYVRTICDKTPQDCRFYACGGDGTLNEVAKGAFGSDNEIAMIPIGTGNDFPRNFADADFTDIENQVCGNAVKIDIIKCSDTIGVNMFNIGFDACCVKTMEQLRGIKALPSGMAYIGGVIHNLVKMPHIEAKIIFDDGSYISGKYLLCAIANGKYCGGGFCAASLAELSDGLIDVLCVGLVSRRKFVSLVGKYKNGTLLDDEKARSLYTFKKCRKLSIESEKDMTVSIDGELICSKKLDFKIIPDAMKFSVPKIKK